MAIQTSNGSAREEWVKVFLPAAAIFMVYLLFVTFGRSDEVKRLREKHADAMSSAVTEDELAVIHNAFVQLKNNRDQLKDDVFKANVELEKLVEPFRTSGKSHTTAEISRLCRNHSIGVLGQKRTGEIKLSSLRRESVQLLEDRVGNGDVHFSEMDLQASYSDVTDFLQKLPSELPSVLPIGLELISETTETGNSSQRVWRLILLM